MSLNRIVTLLYDYQHRVFQDFESPSRLNLCHCKQLRFSNYGFFQFNSSSKGLFIWCWASPGTPAGWPCPDLTSTKNSIALLIMFYLSQASLVRRDSAFAHLRPWLTWLVFLDINRAAQAGATLTLFTIQHQLYMCIGVFTQFEAGWHLKRSRQADNCMKKKKFSPSLQGYFSHHFNFSSVTAHSGWLGACNHVIRERVMLCMFEL